MEDRTYLNNNTIDRSVYRTLASVNFDILPDEMRESFETKWIFNFQDNERKGRVADFRGAYGDELLSELVIDTLQDSVQFYYISLVHIGRIWKVSDLALKNIEIAQKRDNIDQTINNNIAALNDYSKSPFSTEMLQKGYTELFSIAQEKHTVALTKAKKWWNVWLQEVRRLRGGIDKASSQYHGHGMRNDKYKYTQYASLNIFATLEKTSFENQELHNLFESEGIQYNLKNRSGSRSWLLKKILSLDRETMREWQYLLKAYSESKARDLALIEAQNLQPVMFLTQQSLTDTFAGGDLFSEYYPMKKIPDNKLRTLYQQCRLPDDSYFYFAKKWMDSLDDEFNGYSDKISNKDLLNEPDIEWLIYRCDSAIKRNWVLQKNTLPLASTQESFQRIFESNWILPLVKLVFYDKKSKPLLSQSDWISLITKTLEGMNKLGYQLEMPELRRLKDLWQKMIDNGYVYIW